MKTVINCDICGRSKTELPIPFSIDTPQLTNDEDGLIICHLCKDQINPKSVNITENSESDEKLRPLVGKSAGAICRTLELPFVPPYKSVIEAASKIAYDQDLYMSAWLFVDQWMDGTCLWRSEDGKQTALVKPDGDVQIKQR
jgi:hypothetical protein